MRKLAAVVALLIFVGHSAFAEEAGLKVNVEAKSPDDVELITKIIRGTYPMLDPDQQQLIRDGLFFKAVEPFGGAAAYGPEDDPDYRYPDRTLYPAGTIKVNLTLAVLHMAYSVYATRGDPREHPWYYVLLEVVAHEIKHAQQYIKEPVRALVHPSECPEGLCDEAKLAATRKKFRYEIEALAYGREIKCRGSQTPVERCNRDFSALLSFYEMMYDPAVLTRKCVAGTLDKEERARAERYVRFPPPEDVVVNYPYLSPVLERLKDCVREDGEKKAAH